MTMDFRKHPYKYPEAESTALWLSFGSLHSVALKTVSLGVQSDCWLPGLFFSPAAQMAPQQMQLWWSESFCDLHASQPVMIIFIVDLTKTEMQQECFDPL